MTRKKGLWPIDHPDKLVKRVEEEDKQEEQDEEEEGEQEEDDEEEHSDEDDVVVVGDVHEEDSTQVVAQQPTVVPPSKRPRLQEWVYDHVEHAPHRTPKSMSLDKRRPDSVTSSSRPSPPQTKMQHSRFCLTQKNNKLTMSWRCLNTTLHGGCLVLMPYTCTYALTSSDRRSMVFVAAPPRTYETRSG